MPQFLRSLILDMYIINAQNLCVVTLCSNVVDLVPKLEMGVLNCVGVYI